MAKLSIGGQAVMEGVMMKSPGYVAISVRKPDRSIKTKVERYISWSKRHKVLGLPFIRGAVSLFEMLVLGMKALSFSANEAAATDEEKKELSSVAMGFAIGLSVILGLGLFLLLPYGITLLFGLREESSSFLFNLVDGIIKLLIFVLYIYLISMMKDIKRVFQYHGAEHRSVHCYEAGKDLTPENALRYSSLHKRCGTSFMFIVILTMIIVFSVIPSLAVLLFPSFDALGFWAKRGILLSARFLFIIPVAGISYEILKLSSRFEENILMRAVSYPGLLIQRMTTGKPTKAQLEVAIASIRAVLEKEEPGTSKQGKKKDRH